MQTDRVLVPLAHADYEIVQLCNRIADGSKALTRMNEREQLLWFGLFAAGLCAVAILNGGASELVQFFGDFGYLLVFSGVVGLPIWIARDRKLGRALRLDVDSARVELERSGYEYQEGGLDRAARLYRLTEIEGVASAFT